MAAVEERQHEPEQASRAVPPMRTTPGTPSAGPTLWLNTKRWVLMTVAPAYASLYARLHERNGEHFRMAMSVEPAMGDTTFWQPVLAAQQQAHQAGTALHLVGFHKGAREVEVGCVIGFSGIVHEEFECCWLGYRMDRSLEGQGLMHEALTAAVASVFERYKLHRVMASHQPDNLRSASVLRRLGFGIDGYARDFMRINGAWRDNVLVSLINPAH